MSSTPKAPTEGWFVVLCPRCWQIVSWGKETAALEMHSLRLRQRFLTDGHTVSLHLMGSIGLEDETTECGLSLPFGVAMDLLFLFAFTGPRTAPSTAAPDGEEAYRESLLVALDRNTQRLCDAINDLAWKIAPK